MKNLFSISLLILSLSFPIFAEASHERTNVLFPLSDSLSVISPNGGEKWEINTIKEIKWESYEVENLRIEFTTDDSSWNTIISTISADIESYFWMVPNTPSKLCRIRITSIQDSTITDSSDGFFTIGKFSEAEPNNTKEEANLLEVGNSLDGSIYPEGDVDYYKFYAAAQDTAMIYFSNRNNSQLSSFVIIYDENDIIWWSSSFDYYYEQLEIPFLIPSTGNYYIRIGYSWIYSSQSAQSPKENLNRLLRQKELKKNTNVNETTALTGDYRISLRKYSPSAPVVNEIYCWNTYYNSTFISVGLNTNGLKTKVKIEYGTDTNYLNSLILPEVAANLYSDVVRAKLSNLESNTSYYVRAVAENDSGTGYSYNFSLLTPEKPEFWEIKSIDSLNDYCSFNGASFANENLGYLTSLHYSYETGYVSYKIFKTTDGGNTCINSYNSDYLLRKPFCIDSLHAAVLTDNNNRILTTTNGGSTWVFRNTWSSEYLNDLYFIDANNGFTIGSNGKILKTTNGGRNWKTINSGTNYSLSSICFSDTNNGWIAGDYGTILKTTDGGSTWNSQNCGMNNSINKICFVDPLNGFLLDWTGVYKTTDGGSSWSSQNCYFNDISFLNKNCGLGLIGNQISLTSDGGENWIPQISGTSNSLTSIAKTGNNWILIGDGGTILKSKYNLVSVEKETQNLPLSFELFQNYPNPFNPTTNFEFQISNCGFVSLKVFDALGRDVATILNEELPAGNYKYQWNAGGLASGVYFYRLQAGGFVDTKKLILLK